GPMTVTGGADQTSIAAGVGDSIVGSGGAMTGDRNPGFGGKDTIVGGKGNLTVYRAVGDTGVGGAGALVYNQNTGPARKAMIAGGAGSMPVTDLGPSETIIGSTGGTTSSDDSYGQGGKSSITGGSGAGTLADGENTFIKAGVGDTVVGGTSLTLINAAAGS